MLSIGWVMFWKAVVVAAWLAALARYQAYKWKRRRDGIVMRYDERRGVYFDPLARNEKRARAVVYFFGAIFGIYVVLVVWAILTAQ